MSLSTRKIQSERHVHGISLMRIAPIPQEMVLNYLAEYVLGQPRSY
jgi:acyl-CoA dehydrogenase